MAASVAQRMPWRSFRWLRAWPVPRPDARAVNHTDRLSRWRAESALLRETLPWPGGSRPSRQTQPPRRTRCPNKQPRRPHQPRTGSGSWPPKSDPGGRQNASTVARSAATPPRFTSVPCFSGAGWAAAPLRYGRADSQGALPIAGKRWFQEPLARLRGTRERVILRIVSGTCTTGSLDFTVVTGASAHQGSRGRGVIFAQHVTGTLMPDTRWNWQRCRLLATWRRWHRYATALSPSCHHATCCYRVAVV